MVKSNCEELKLFFVDVSQLNSYARNLRNDFSILLILIFY